MFQKSHRQTPGVKRGSALPPDGGEPISRLPLPAPLRYAVLGVLLFLLIGMQGGGGERQSAVAATAVLVVCLFGSMPQWAGRHRLSLPVLAVCFYFLVNCAAGLYSRFGSFAATEFGKILAAFCVFSVILLRARKGEAPCLAAMAAAVSAAFGLLSIDASCAGLFSRPFFRFMDGVLGAHYRNLYTGYETGTRIVGIFSNPNVLAGFLALGIFLSLYLVRAAKTRKGRLGGCILLTVNSLSFLLAFSMGAIATFMAAVLFYLLAETKGRRLSLFVLMVETALVTLLMVFVATPGLGQYSGGVSFLPDLAALGGGALLWAVHEFGGLRLSERLSGQGRAAGLAIGGLAALLCLYLVLAFNVTGGYTLAPGASLRRSVYPSAGAYTLEGTWSGDAAVTVESQNQVDTVMHTSSVLYSGPLDGAAFTVPEDSKVVYLTFRSGQGADLDRVALSGGPAVKLGYKLLPGFAANRLQGLWANQNAIQRLTFFQDGLRMYAQSPIIGNGLGSVEGLVLSVQDFFYESRYVHNQYIQVLAEMGIPGLLAFLFLLSSTAVTLFRRRREGETDHLLPALAGCLAVAALHGLSEVDWSMGPYQSLVLATFAMTAVSFGRPLPGTDRKAVGLAFPISIGVVCCLFAWLLGNNIYAEKAYGEVKAGLREQTPYTMTELANQDRYNWAQYKLDMAVNAAESPREEFATTAAQYAEECRKLRIHSVNLSLETYVYLPMGRYEELFQASREGIPQAASRADTWREEFNLYELMLSELFRQQDPDLQWFAEQVYQTYQMLVDYNTHRLEHVTLSDNNLHFLDRVLFLRQTGLSGLEADAILDRFVFDSESASDTNGDGLPERLGSVNGTLARSGDRWTLAAGDALVLPFRHSGGGEAELTLRCGDAAVVSGVALNGVPLEVETGGDTLTARLPLSADTVDYTLTIGAGADLELLSLSVLLDPSVS